MRKIQLFLLVLIFLPLVSSQIIFLDNPKNVYNFEDFISIDFSIKQEVFTRGDVQAFLVCGNNEKLVFQQFNEFKNGQEKNFSLFFLASIKGNCYAKILFNDESEKTQKFKITDNIITAFGLNNKFFLPLEEIKINGTANKENSEKLNGIAIISIENLINQTVEVKEGKFSFSYIFEKDVAPGVYSVEVFAIEKNFNGDEINRGNFSEKIEIKSYPAKIKIESLEFFKPPYEFQIKASLLDQTNALFHDEILIVKIFDPKNEIFMQDAENSGERFNISFKENTLRGGWKINVYYGDLFASKSFYVEDNREIKIELGKEGCEINNSFCKINISNIGNVPYNGVIDVSFQNENSNETFPLNINLSKGDSEIFEFELEGYFNISAGDQNFENVYLSPITGAVLFEGSKKKTYIFIVVLLIVLIVFFFIWKKIHKTNLSFLRKNKNNKTKDFLPSLNTEKPIQKPEEKQIAEKEIKEINPVNKTPVKKEVSEKEKIINKNKFQKKIYSIFFHDVNYEKLEKFLQKYNLVLHRASGDSFFIITYSDKDLSKKLTEIVFKISKEFKGISTILHSEIFENKISSISSVLITKNLVSYLNGFFVTENIAEKLEKNHGFRINKDKSFRVKERVIKLYTVYKL